LQNFTCPAVSGTPPEVTAAVNVITEPAVALDGETARVVDVLLAASAAVDRKRVLTIKSTGIKEHGEKLRRMFFCVLRLWTKVMM
jgi:hypothetical protein